MPVVVPMHLTTLGQCKTPDEFKFELHKLLDPALRKYKVMGTDILVATYIEPEVTSGGIFKSDKSQQEILFQGTVGLVVGMGPLVGKYDASGKVWEGITPQLDDWVVLRFADAWEIHLDGVSCRLIDPENIRGIIDTPEIITHRPAVVSSQVVGTGYVSGGNSSRVPAGSWVAPSTAITGLAQPIEDLKREYTREWTAMSNATNSVLKRG